MSYPIGRSCTAALLCVTAFASRAQALQLVWQAPPECPTGDVVLRDTRRLAGANQGEALEARAIVTQTADQRWRVVIDLSGSATGHRTLTADNCSQLARVSSLIIALAANPDAALDLPGDESNAGAKPLPLPSAQAVDAATPPSPQPIPQTPSGMQPSSPTPAPVPLTQRAVVPVELLSRVGLEWGSLPTHTALLGLGARVRTVDDSVSFALTTHVTQGTGAAFTNGIGASFRVFAAQARACMESGDSHWHVAACGGFQLALVRASAFVRVGDLAASGYVDATTYTLYRWIPGALLGINPRYEFAPRLTAELGADLVIPMTHWQFVIENLAPLYRPEELQYAAYLGLSYRLN